MPVWCFPVRNKAAPRAERWRCALHARVTHLCQHETPAGERTALLWTPLARVADPATVPLRCHTPRQTRPLRPGAERALALNALI
jgi:hypothetical protein